MPLIGQNRGRFGLQTQTLIDVRQVSKSFERGARVLDGVTFSVQRREMVALIGAPGSGKSTLIRALAGLVAIERSPGSDAQNRAVIEPAANTPGPQAAPTTATIHM
jgi:ABC-type phosphate/phosphonate transport system ATPase subunit